MMMPDFPSPTALPDGHDTDSGTSDAEDDGGDRLGCA